MYNFTISDNLDQIWVNGPDNYMTATKIEDYRQKRNKSDYNFIEAINENPL